MANKVKDSRTRGADLTGHAVISLRDMLPTFRLTSESPGRAAPWDVTITLRSGRITQRLLVESKSVGEPRYLAQAITGLALATRRSPRSYGVIVAPYIGPEGQRLCKDSGVGYLDLTGNAFLSFDHVLIDRKSGERPPRAKARLRRLFSPKSSRILRVLLTEPDQTWTLTRLATEAQISVRSVHLVINALEEKAFVDKRRGAIRLAQPAALIDLWAENYRFDQHRRETFYTFVRSPRELASRLAAQAASQSIRLALTLHAGAAMVAPFVRYTDVHAYIDGDIGHFAKALDLRPVETGGSVHLVEPNDDGVFHHTQVIQGIPVVSNPQLYLDLLHYPARGREQAEELRRQKLGY
jgi:hypothetical protein